MLNVESCAVRNVECLIVGEADVELRAKRNVEC